MNSKIRTVAIIGAGIIGVTTAYLLTKAGYDVIILIDAEEGVALQTSYANGGQLSYSYIDAMSSPSLLKKIPSILLSQDEAFHVHLSVDPKYLSWGSQFLWNAQSNKEEQNTQNNLRLSLYSRDVMHTVLSELNISFKYRKSGKLHIYTKQDDLDKAKNRAKQKVKWGCPQEILTAQQCIELEPNLIQHTQTLVGGIYSVLDEVGDVPSFANELLEIMRTEQKVETYFNCQVSRIIKKGNVIESIETSSGKITADAYVLATGSDSLNLLKDCGLKLPIYPIKGYSITVPATKKAPNICISDMDNKVVFARIGDHLRIAGLADIMGYDKALDKSRIKHLLKICKSTFPDAGEYDDVLHQWTGFRPATPSSVPIIGQAGASNFYINMGHGMFGWTLAMGSASVLTSLIKQESPLIDATGMRPIDHGVT
ncbi:MAG: D-amino acid dehydrogenase [Cocleimonas sp.]